MPLMPLQTPSAHANPAAVTKTARRILLHSDNAARRAAVREAVGDVADGAPLEWTEGATGPVVVYDVEGQKFDLVILDGESGKVGGMSLARTLKDEVAACPPLLLLIARPQDAWLATWSGADRSVIWPADPFGFAATVADMLR
jgi:DNA-binding response OmpR family regulator